MNQKETAMIILAGGASSRMGQDKSNLKIKGRTFLESQIQKGKELNVPQIYISGYRGSECREEIVMDRIEKRGPLGGLEACLRKAGRDGYSQCLVLGVDTPLVPVKELRNLLDFAENTGTCSATLLRHKGREESLMAVYKSSLCDEIAAFLESGQSSVFRFLNKIGYDLYDASEKEVYFTNINDPEVYRQIKKQLEDQI